VDKLTQANLQLSEEILKKYGEFSVEDIAEFLAKEFSHVLGKKKSYNYRK
jgi:hypothetical protein